MAFQVSNDSVRERWVKALLPSAFILMLFIVYLFSTGNPALAKLRKKLESTQSATVSESVLFQLNQELQQERKKESDLKDEIALLENAVQQQKQLFDRSSETDRLQQVIKLSREHSLALNSQKTVYSVEVSPLREKALQTLAKLLDRRLVYQELELCGTYNDAKAFLETLSQEQTNVIPVSLELLEKDKRTQKETTPANVAQRHSWQLHLLF